MRRKQPKRARAGQVRPLALPSWCTKFRKTTQHTAQRRQKALCTLLLNCLVMLRAIPGADDGADGGKDHGGIHGPTAPMTSTDPISEPPPLLPLPGVDAYLSAAFPDPERNPRDPSVRTGPPDNPAPAPGPDNPPGPGPGPGPPGPGFPCGFPCP